MEIKIIISLFITVFLFYFIRRIQVYKYLNKKFGTSLKQFEVNRAWNTIIIRNSPTIVSFYKNFLVIKYLWTGKEFIIPRGQNEINIFYGTIYFVIEIPVETTSSYKKIQLTCFKGEKEQFFLDYFNIEH